MKTIYDEKMINEQYEKLYEKARRNEQLDPYSRSLGAVLGHTIDAIGLSKDSNNPLDLFDLSKDKINNAIIVMYMYFRSTGDSVAECKQKVIKKIGGYLFFTVCNLCNQKEDMECVPTAKGSSLYLEIKKQNDNILLVDVLSIFEKFINRNLRYDKETESMIIVDSEELIESISKQINEN